MKRSSRGMAWILGLSLGLAGSGLAEEWPVLSVTAPTAVPAETQAPAPETETADEAPHPAGTPETAEAETEAPGPEVPERTVLFWNTPVSSRDTEATFEGKEFVHLTELDQLLTEMPNLKKVNLWDKRTYLKEILPLFEAHPEVEIGMTITLNPSHVLRTDMTAYSTLGRQPQIAKMHTWFFGCLKGLKALDIGHMNTHSLDFLQATAPLKILIVADNGLRDRDIQALQYQNDLEYLLVENEQIVLMASRQTELARRVPPGTEIELSEARDERFVTLTSGHSVRAIQDHLCARLGLNPQVLLEVPGMDAAKLIAAESAAVMVCPYGFIQGDPRVEERVSCYPLRCHGIERHFYFCYPRRTRLTAPMRDLYELARGCCRAHTMSA